MKFKIGDIVTDKKNGKLVRVVGTSVANGYLLQNEDKSYTYCYDANVYRVLSDSDNKTDIKERLEEDLINT